MNLPIQLSKRSFILDALGGVMIIILFLILLVIL